MDGWIAPSQSTPDVRNSIQSRPPPKTVTARHRNQRCNRRDHLEQKFETYHIVVFVFKLEKKICLLFI